MNLPVEGAGWRGPGAVAVIALFLTACSGTVASPGVSPTPDGQTPAASAERRPPFLSGRIGGRCVGRPLHSSRLYQQCAGGVPAGARSIFAGTGQAEVCQEMADRRQPRSSGASRG